MGIWKERGLEVERSSRVDRKPCRLLSVYVSGRLDVHRPCDPPRQGGPAIVIAPFLFAQNSTKKTSFSFASPSASQNTIRPVHLYKTSCLRLLFASPFASPCG